MEAKKTIRMYVGFSMVMSFGMAFVASSYVMYLRQAGMNLLQSNMVNFFFYAAIFIFEVPTGAVADVFGRKTSYVISCFLLGLSFVMYAMVKSCSGFALAEIVGGIGVTFASGAYDAWLVDRLKMLKHETDLAEVMALEQRFSLLASMTGAIIGTKVAASDMRLPWVVAGLVQMIVGLAALVLMQEDGFQKKAFKLCEGWKSMKNTVQLSITYAREQKQVRFLFLIGFLMTMALQGPNMQWQPFFSRFLGEEVSPLGWVFAGMMMAVMAGSFLIKRFKSLCNGVRKTLLLTQMGIGGAVALAAYMKWMPMAMFIFLVHEMFRGIYWPVKEAFLHNQIPSSERATIVSVDSMVRQVGGMIGLVGTGLLAKHTSISFTWVISGFLLFLAAFWLLRKNSP